MIYGQSITLTAARGRQRPWRHVAGGRAWPRPGHPARRVLPRWWVQGDVAPERTYLLGVGATSCFRLLNPKQS